MKVNQAYRQGCIIRLISALLFAGAVDVCTAGSRDAASSPPMSSSSAPVSGPIRDPMNPQDYMANLASRLNSADEKGLLLKGMQGRQGQETRSPGRNVATPPPAANPRVPAMSSGAPLSWDFPTRTRAGSSVQENGEGQPSRPRVTPGEQEKADTSRQVPVQQVSSMTVLNGLSPENRAAQRVLDDLGVPSTTREPATPPPAAGNRSGTSVSGPGRQTASPNPVASHRISGGSPTPQVSMEGTSSRQTAQEPASLNEMLLSGQTGLTLWTKPAPSNLAERVVLEDLFASSEMSFGFGALYESAPWSLGEDLDKYRAHAVRAGSRDSGESLGRALQRAGMALEGSVNVFVLGYASERTEALRANDGKGFFDEPGRVPEQAGETIASFTDGVYSLANLILLDALPDLPKDVYTDNHPIVRPLVFTGRTIGGVWKTAEEIGNALTWGYFDNVTGTIGLVIGDVLEAVKHVSQAATNLVRAPVQLLAGKNEPTERAMDWVLLVPIEFVSNSLQMQGIANMDDYRTAFEDKGVVGSILEFGGSTFLLYRTVDEIVDSHKDKRRRRSGSDASPEPPAAPAEPPAGGVTPPPPTGSDLIFILNGEWPSISPDGIIYVGGEWPTIWRGLQ